MNRKKGWRQVLDAAPRGVPILVVDDDAQVRQALARLLTRSGYRVQVAASAEEADQWLGSERFHACLLDIELPRMSGVEFLTWSAVKDPEMPVIMLTGMDAPDLALECLDHGARTFLVKPMEPDFLLRALRDALAVRELLVDHNERNGGTARADDAWRTFS